MRARSIARERTLWNAIENPPILRHRTRTHTHKRAHAYKMCTGTLRCNNANWWCSPHTRNARARFCVSVCERASGTGKKNAHTQTHHPNNTHTSAHSNWLRCQRFNAARANLARLQRPRRRRRRRRRTSSHHHHRASSSSRPAVYVCVCWSVCVCVFVKHQAHAAGAALRCCGSVLPVVNLMVCKVHSWTLAQHTAHDHDGTHEASTTGERGAHTNNNNNIPTTHTRQTHTHLNTHTHTQTNYNHMFI